MRRKIALATVTVAIVACVGCSAGGERQEDPTSSATADETIDDRGSATSPVEIFGGWPGERRLFSSNGASRPIVVSACADLSFPAWAPDGAHIAAGCVRGARGVPDLVIIDPIGNIVDRTSASPFNVAWSPTGDAYTISTGPFSSVNISSVRIRRIRPQVEDAITIADLGDLGRLGGISPDGLTIAVYRDHSAACAPSCATGLLVVDVASGDERTLGDLVPLSWVLGGSALIAAAQHSDGSDTASYDVALIDITTGAMTALPSLDGGVQFWLSDNGRFVAWTPSPTAGDDLGILDLLHPEPRSIAGSELSYGHQAIPRGHVGVDDDGTVYWVTDTRTGLGVYRSVPGWTSFDQIAELRGGYTAELTPDLTHVAYVTAGDPNSNLYVATIDGNDVTLVSDDPFSDYAIRPLPRN